uniref:Uncharacterized protein n=1 Tax=Romanomermis culicivorax TaxID=13658 RepID=A0A915IM55_ROMCU
MEVDEIRQHISNSKNDNGFECSEFHCEEFESMEAGGVGSSLHRSSRPSASVTKARSKMTRPSLYLCVSSVANSYIQPNFVLHFLHETSRTI